MWDKGGGAGWQQTHTLGEGLTLKGEEEGERIVVASSPDHYRPASALQSIATTP